MPRQCFYIPYDQYDDNGYIPSVVTEGEEGHRPLTGNGVTSQLWYWGKTYEKAKAVCDRENEKMYGLSPKDAAAIVLSSIGTASRSATERKKNPGENRR